MYTDIPFWLSLVMMTAGFAALAWSSDLFVDGASRVAKFFGISPLIIGMVIIGFGTSAPELCVSVMSGLSGHANLSLGNAYGSCIFNIAIILGIAALISPLVVRPSIAFVSGPGLAAIALFSLALLRDGTCSRAEASVLLAAFLVILPIYCWFDQKSKGSAEPAPSAPAADDGVRNAGGLWLSFVKLAVGLGVLVGSSHILVWGAVDFAKWMGVSDLVIGLTIIAMGTSLPELASAVASARRGEDEFVLGNIIGSNLFNTLAVVGLAVFISPLEAPPGGGSAFSSYILTRDLPLMALLSLSILLFGSNWRAPRREGRVSRPEAVLWIVSFIVYTVVMFLQETGRL